MRQPGIIANYLPLNNSNFRYRFSVPLGSSNFALFAETEQLVLAGGMMSEPATFPGYHYPAATLSHVGLLSHVFGVSLIKDAQPHILDRALQT
jgi:hypothetical protein